MRSRDGGEFHEEQHLSPEPERCLHRQASFMDVLALS